MASGDDEEHGWQGWYDRKSALMEASLGKQHELVLHAFIGYAAGGPLDLYYYTDGMPGTAIATKELCVSPEEGSSNDIYDVYELVMFTKHQLNQRDAKDEATAFGNAHSSINAILNCIARYSTDATLNPNETCEFPTNFERVGGKCLIFDGYACHNDEVAGKFGLLALIEVFRSEMEFARANGGAQLIQRLKDEGRYPYSDLDREPVA